MLNSFVEKLATLFFMFMGFCALAYPALAAIASEKKTINENDFRHLVVFGLWLILVTLLVIAGFLFINAT